MEESINFDSAPFIKITRINYGEALSRRSESVFVINIIKKTKNSPKKLARRYYNRIAAGFMPGVAVFLLVAVSAYTGFGFPWFDKAHLAALGLLLSSLATVLAIVKVFAGTPSFDSFKQEKADWGKFIIEVSGLTLAVFILCAFLFNQSERMSSELDAAVENSRTRGDTSLDVSILLRKLCQLAQISSPDRSDEFCPPALPDHLPPVDRNP